MTEVGKEREALLAASVNSKRDGTLSFPQMANADFPVPNPIWHSGSGFSILPAEGPRIVFHAMLSFSEFTLPPESQKRNSPEEI